MFVCVCVLIEDFFVGKKIIATNIYTWHPEKVWKLLKNFSIATMYKLKLFDLAVLALLYHQEIFTFCWVTAQGTGNSTVGWLGQEEKILLNPE